MKIKNSIIRGFFLIIPLLFYSCASTSVKESDQKETITLLFAGDIMAHRPNYNMKDYSQIWKDIKPYVSECDFSFANIEAPVCDELPFSPYPNFNMQSSYPEAAIGAGFNVFSVINNHTNDQGLEGINATRLWGEKIEDKTKHSERPVYVTGINEKPKMPVSYRIIQKGDWKILFVAVTEILNRPDYRNYLNYIVASRTNWEEFSEYLTQLRNEHPCDLMVLSIHSDEPEYFLPASSKRIKYYHELTEKCVDVIWTNHPHIPREREIIGNRNNNQLEKVIIYGNGNLISGQRWEPDFENPSNPRDDTGDGYLMKVTFCKTKKNPKPYIESTETRFITTYINTTWEFVIKYLDDNFITYLVESGRKNWADYIRARKSITEKIKETTIWE